MNLRTQDKPSVAAAKAAISTATGYRIDADPRLPSQKRKPRTRRRPDPLAGIFEQEVLPLLQREPHLRAVTIFEELLRPPSCRTARNAPWAGFRTRWCSMRGVGGWSASRWPGACGPNGRRLLNMAIWQRRPQGVGAPQRPGRAVHVDFGQRRRQAGVRPSTGAVGLRMATRCARAFFATLECEGRRNVDSASGAPLP